MKIDRNVMSLLIAAVFIAVWIGPVFAAAEIDGPRVLEVGGRPEIRLGAKWNPLSKGDPLPKGAEIRTAQDASVFFTFDAGLETVARLGSGARMAVRGGAGGPVFLEKGSLFLLREPARKKDVFLVAAGSSRVYVESGGISVDVKPMDTLIKVFGDRVRVAAGSKSALKDVTEGFECRLRSGAFELRRMTYVDYAEWLAWAKRGYELKDDADADVLEKEYGI